jgi:hypothetical protein
VRTQTASPGQNSSWTVCIRPRSPQCPSELLNACGRLFVVDCLVACQQSKFRRYSAEYPDHGAVYASEADVQDARRRKDERQLVDSIVKRLVSGTIPFPYKYNFVTRTQVVTWFRRLQSLPLQLSRSKFTVHGYYSPEPPTDVPLPSASASGSTAPEQLSGFDTGAGCCTFDLVVDGCVAATGGGRLGF